MTLTTPPLHTLRAFVGLPLVLVAVAASASAQGNEGEKRQPLPVRSAPIAIEAPEIFTPDWAARETELARWVADYSEWREWALRWGNRREPGWFSSRERRKRPDPPEWLSAECGVSSEPNATIAEACDFLAEWAAGSLPQQRPAGALASKASEEPEKTIWWEHVHLDGGWPALQSGSGLYGVIGMHATTSVRGRLQVFVAPGAMLLNVPTRGGRRAWKVATNYGIAFRLGEFNFPGKRRALLHLNVAKAWLLAAGSDVLTRTTDFAGLSITFKRTP